MKKVISTSNAPAAIGPYSQAIETDGYVFTSGQIPINPATGEVEGKTIEEQTEQVMHNIGALLEASGLTFANVVKTTCICQVFPERSSGPFLLCRCRSAEGRKA